MEFNSDNLSQLKETILELLAEVRERDLRVAALAERPFDNSEALKGVLVDRLKNYHLGKAQLCFLKW